jgi:hypothetical protein
MSSPTLKSSQVLYHLNRSASPNPDIETSAGPAQTWPLRPAGVQSVSAGQKERSDRLRAHRDHRFEYPQPEGTPQRGLQ